MQTGKGAVLPAQGVPDRRDARPGAGCIPLFQLQPCGVGKGGISQYFRGEIADFRVYAFSMRDALLAGIHEGWPVAPSCTVTISPAPTVTPSLELTQTREPLLKPSSVLWLPLDGHAQDVSSSTTMPPRPTATSYGPDRCNVTNASIELAGTVASYVLPPGSVWDGISDFTIAFWHIGLASSDECVANVFASGSATFLSLELVPSTAQVRLTLDGMTVTSPRRRLHARQLEPLRRHAPGR